MFLLSFLQNGYFRAEGGAQHSGELELHVGKGDGTENRKQGSVLDAMNISKICNNCERKLQPLTLRMCRWQLLVELRVKCT